MATNHIVMIKFNSNNLPQYQWESICTCGFHGRSGSESGAVSVGGQHLTFNGVDVNDSTLVKYVPTPKVPVAGITDEQVREEIKAGLVPNAPANSIPQVATGGATGDSSTSLNGGNGSKIRMASQS